MGRLLIDFARAIERYLEAKLPIKLGVNKKNELTRLFFEICTAQDISITECAEKSKIEKIIEDGSGELFHKLKRSLLALRYPSMTKECDARIMPIKMDAGFVECSPWNGELSARSIFVEESVKNLKWTDDFLEKFPAAKINFIKDVVGARRAVPLQYNSRRDNVFLIRHKSAFIKICPCATGCVRCGYWVLNMGFGCPIDCAYCYLQTYSNAPGIMLPANIDGYLEAIEKFDAKAALGTRIGTGEFTDSLALDRYTGYSSLLIPFFKNTKNLVLELKTKVSNIDTVLKEKSHDNVVISWSINTPYVSEKYEKGASPVRDRIIAACRASESGYRVGFHFDPIVYYKNWEKDYQETVKELFSSESIRKKTAWISLGTFRHQPELKQIAEQRFKDNLMFYEGEFFIDSGGKMRYHKTLRTEMYRKMLKWIEDSGVSSQKIYLCMEEDGV